MTDSHVHLEQGPYTLGWVQKFVDTAVKRGITELWLLDHSYLFPEFLPMYEPARQSSSFVREWLGRRGGTRSLPEYLFLIEAARAQEWPVKLRFGLEICYFCGAEDFVRTQTQDLKLDFLIGSVHFIGDFAFDHKPELWEGVAVDAAYRRFFEDSVSLAESGLFTVLAHPDSLKLYGHRPGFDLAPQYEALANALAKSGTLVEQNSGVSRRCPGIRPGMEPGLLEAMRRHGVKITTASDAHCPEDVGAGVAELC